MAYEELKEQIKQVIKPNDNQEITGANMQSTLLQIVDSIDDTKVDTSDIVQTTGTSTTSVMSQAATTSQVNKFTPISSALPDDLQQAKISLYPTVGGETEVNNIFGYEAITLKGTPPSSGNTFTFNYDYFSIGNNDKTYWFHFICYVPKDCTLVFLGINASLELVSGTALKEGINYVVGKITDVSSVTADFLGTYGNFSGLDSTDVFYILKNESYCYTGLQRFNFSNDSANIATNTANIATNTANIATKVDKEEGKGLSTNDYTDEDSQNVKSVISENLTTLLYTNKHNRFSGLNYNTEDGSFYKSSTASGWQYLTQSNSDYKIEIGKNYLFVVDMLISKSTIHEGDDSSSGNIYPSLEMKVNSTSNHIGSVRLTGLVLGTRSTIYGIVYSSALKEDYINLYPDGNYFNFLQIGNYTADDELEGVIYNAVFCELDSTDNAENIINAIINTNFLDGVSVVNNSMHSNTSDYATRASYAENVATLPNIECWGDSLTAQNYGQYLATLSSREVTSKGYGGKTSAYIRDLYLANADKNKTSIIWVGRNNYSKVDALIEDIRAMTDYFEGHNFLVMLPPNGNYGTFSDDGVEATGEMKGGTSYEQFIELTDKLSKEYQDNFLDIRSACINSYDMGNIKLLSSFTQPAIGSSVQISVSDAIFLTTYNSYDETKFGTDFMSQIRIGYANVYDLYSVESVDSDTLLTVTLVEANRISAGNTVENLTDTGGLDSTIYLKVMQEADYRCYIDDTTQSTFRSDGIHMSDAGKLLVAKIVNRKLKTLGI